MCAYVLSQFCSCYHSHRTMPCVTVQGDRYSIAYFANTRASTLLQGPEKKYAPITFPDILAAKKKHRKSFMKPSDSDMPDDEYIEFQKVTSIGPEFDPVNAANTCIGNTDVALVLKQQQASA